jgi:outer membrane protein TolC
LLAVRNSRDLIVLAVAGGYLQLTATNARVSSAAAQVESSRAIFQQATARYRDGLNSRLDATRAQVQLQTEQQRLRSLQSDFETQKLRLARIIGLPLGQQFAIVDKYSYSPLTDLSLETALQKAFQQRSDLQATAAAMKAAQASVKAAHAEHLPNLTVTADWGVAGLRPTHDATSVYTVSGTLTIPLYEGGRIRGEINQATAALQHENLSLRTLEHRSIRMCARLSSI